MFCRYFDGALVTCKSFVRQSLPVGAMLGPIYSGSNLLVNTLGASFPILLWGKSTRKGNLQLYKDDLSHELHI